ncbi:MAG: ribosome assembly RNA-binding protein YhbY [Cycloclasticus sp.]|jgi:RNA-binding protein|nr:MAG: RNA-binding protein [Cycloclasticus sp. Phe_18]MBV1912151.1 ribosome assembly RNA-binding protein YhbY [Cycloclasticus sp.]MDF1688212.1 ribosome assembly RNA-binding protein YhbY [Cycloclasticus sp.]MEE4290598.1 ribosome assembly RNA-binding protein YhbY [Cycloclasticus sp.]
MALSNPQKKKLKAHAHGLKPVVRLGQSGLTDNVLDEIELAIEHHELIKVKISAEDRDDKKLTIQKIADRTRSDIVQSIGFMAVFYRENSDKKAYS